MTPVAPADGGEARIRRKLAALFAADVAGYSRLMAADEEGTTRRLGEHRAIMDALITHYGGRIANTAGDSVLAECERSVQAVRCAVEMQEALKSRNDALPSDQRLEFRIGLNVGDVIQQGDDLLGDGINVAARLESIAELGRGCISGEVRDQIDGKLTLNCVPMVRQRLKNVRRPVQVFRVAGDGDGKAKSFTLVLPGAAWGQVRIAVGGSIAVFIVAAAWFVWDRWCAVSSPTVAVTPVAGQPQADRAALDARARDSARAREIVASGSFGGHEYVLVGTWGIKWIEVEAEAWAMGGYLATIGSAEENRFIVDMIRSEDTV